MPAPHLPSVSRPRSVASPPAGHVSCRFPSLYHVLYRLRRSWRREAQKGGGAGTVGPGGDGQTCDETRHHAIIVPRRGASGRTGVYEKQRRRGERDRAQKKKGHSRRSSEPARASAGRIHGARLGQDTYFRGHRRRGAWCALCDGRSAGCGGIER